MQKHQRQVSFANSQMYRITTAKQQVCFVAAYSFDEPDAFDTKALVQCLQSLKVRLL